MPEQIKLVLVVLTLTSLATAQRFFVEQQQVKLTIPISKDTFHVLDKYPIFQVKFTDLDGSASDRYEWSINPASEFLTISKHNGEIYFHRSLPRSQQGRIIAQVANTNTKSVAKTNIEFNFVEMAKEEFCLKFSCFYDHIRYLTPEFHIRKHNSNKEQFLGHLRPSLYHRVCDHLKFLYLLGNGSDLVSLTLKDQLAKTTKMDFEALDNPNITINITCEITSADFKQDLATTWKVLPITIIDRNDNFATVDELSKKVDIFRSKWNYKQASCVGYSTVTLSFIQQGEEVNPQAPVIFHDRDSLKANQNVEIKIAGNNSLFYNVCEPKSQSNPETHNNSSIFLCRIYFTRDGVLESNLCLLLQAFDSDLKKKALATSRICIHPGASSDANATGAHSQPLRDNLSVRFKCDDVCIVLVFGLPCLIVVLAAVFVALSNTRLHHHFSSIQNHGSSSINNSQQIQAVQYTTANETKSGHPDFYVQRWEVDRKDVLVGGVIGEGEFGVVKMASLKAQPVVIKTVKDVCNYSEVTSLKKEFEQLQKVSVDCHENVIKLMGSYSKGDTPWIILEFCVFESLKNYLLASRLIEMQNDSDDVDKIDAKDILQFSMQIAQGMAYLSIKKLVHRDLAARNVLLSEGKVCKISDFGLTRKVCSSCDIYSKCSDDKVPLKWLSPESLSMAEEYTTKSDCWSFGILGYELVMLGTSPYPELQVFNHKDMYNRLKDGYRMSRPSNCSEDLFMIFESCWSFNPAERPTFPELAKLFQQLLASSDGPELWTTPAFSGDDLQGYDVSYYEAYIERVRKNRAAAERKQAKLSSLVDIPKSLSESNAIVSRLQKTLLKKTSLSCSNVGTSLDNPGYNGSFDSIQSMRVRQTKRKFSELETTHEINLSATSSTPLIGYCAMVHGQSSSDTVSAPSIQESPSSDYLPMDLFTSARTLTSSSNEDTTVI